MAGLTVSQVARESGVNASAIRFYEAQGLIAATRTSGGQRRFDDQAACRVKVARVAQGIGLSVQEIRDLLAILPPSPSLKDWKALHIRLSTEAATRIAKLNAALEDIKSGGKLCQL